MSEVVLHPGSGSPLGLGSWLSEMRANVICRTSPPCFPADPQPPGHGQPVLVLPGFLTADWATTRLRRFLTSIGYDVYPWELGTNWGPTDRLVSRLEARVREIHEKTGRRVCLVGLSLGGAFARALAHRMPDVIDRVVTLVAPIHFPVETALAPVISMLRPVHNPEFLSEATDIAAHPPVPVTAVYTQTDGILDWRACLQEEAPGYPNVRVEGEHVTIGSNPQAQAAVAQALAARVPPRPGDRAPGIGA